jgi:hypothetical protein
MRADPCSARQMRLCRLSDPVAFASLAVRCFPDEPLPVQLLPSVSVRDAGFFQRRAPVRSDSLVRMGNAECWIERLRAGDVSPCAWTGQ